MWGDEQFRGTGWVSRPRGPLLASKSLSSSSSEEEEEDVEDVEELLDLHLEGVSGSCKDKAKVLPPLQPGPRIHSALSPRGLGHLGASTCCSFQNRRGQEGAISHLVPERTYKVLRRLREVQLKVEKSLQPRHPQQARPRETAWEDQALRAHACVHARINK